MNTGGGCEQYPFRNILTLGTLILRKNHSKCELCGEGLRGLEPKTFHQILDV